MPFEDTKISEFNQYQKSDKASFIIYAHLKCIIEKINRCKNNPENSSTTKISKHIPSGFSISAISSTKSIENKHDIYRRKDCMKKFCEFFRELAMKVIHLRKRWNYQQKSSRNHLKMQKSVIFVKKSLKTNIWKIKK